MKFIALEKEEQLEKISEDEGSNIIFKHNTTCPISKSVHRKLETEGDAISEKTPVYLLDLLSFRELSDAVAQKFNIPHESPQLLLIVNGKCVYNQSLYNISTEDTQQAIEENTKQ